MHERKLFEALQNKKESGVKLEWGSITSNELEQLFCVEALSDGRIAGLYDVEQRVVTRQRNKWDISDRSYRAKKAFEIYKDEVASAMNDSPLSYVQNFEKHDKLQNIITDIQGLTEEEVEMMIAYLIRTNHTLKTFAMEHIKYKAFYKSQFSE